MDAIDHSTEKNDALLINETIGTNESKTSSRKLAGVMRALVMMHKKKKGSSRSCENHSNELAELIECFEEGEVRNFVQKHVQTKQKLPLTTAYIELIDNHRHGHRGILLVIQLYEAIFDELLKRIKEGIYDDDNDEVTTDIMEHIAWLLNQDYDSFLRLSLIYTNRSSSIDTSHILQISRQDLVERLVSTRIFRIVLRSRYQSGPAQIFKVECLLFLILFLCHIFSHLTQRRAFNTRPIVLQWFFILFAIPPLHYLTTRIQFQIHFLATVERRARHLSISSRSSRSTSDRKNVPSMIRNYFYYPLFAVLEIMVWLWNRLAIILSISLFFPILFFVFLYKPHIFKRCAKRLRITFYTKPEFAFTYDKKWIYLPVSWRRDSLNWIEAIFIMLAWGWLFISVRYLYFRIQLEREPPFSNHIFDLLNAGTLFGWLRMLGLLTASPRFAPFIIFLSRRIFIDLKVFFLVLFILYAAFAHTLYQSLILNKQFYKETDHHASRYLGSVLTTIYTYILTGEGADGGRFRSIDQIYIIIMTFFMLVVVLNVLIAIVIESYEKAMRHADRIFWRSRFENIVKSYAIFGSLFDDRHEEQGANKEGTTTLIEEAEFLLNQEIIEAYRSRYFTTAAF